MAMWLKVAIPKGDAYLKLKHDEVYMVAVQQLEHGTFVSYHEDLNFKWRSPKQVIKHFMTGAGVDKGSIWEIDKKLVTDVLEGLGVYEGDTRDLNELGNENAKQQSKE